MNNISLNLKEQQMIWNVLNQAQHIGLQSTAELIKKYSVIEEKESYEFKELNDWIKQTQEEYDLINTLKVKLCGDLE